jgi:hypothetical protein
MKTATDRLSRLAEFSTIPNDPAYPEHAGRCHVVALARAYDDPADEGEQVVEPLRRFGEPLVDFCCPIS